MRIEKSEYGMRQPRIKRGSSSQEVCKVEWELAHAAGRQIIDKPGVGAWEEREGVIHLKNPIFDDGKPLEQWYDYLGPRNVIVWNKPGYSAVDMLKENYQPMRKAKSARVVIVKGEMFGGIWVDDNKVRQYGLARGFTEPHLGTMLSLAALVTHEKLE